MATKIPRPLRCGLLGPGRTRQGLGPFLARHLEAAGGEVVAVAGRSLLRTQAAAAELADGLGHGVAAHADARALCALGLDALVVAAPVEAHLPGLRAALAASVPVLCEKPLLLPEESEQTAGLLRDFARHQLLLMENCQWPYVLPLLGKLHPEFDPSTQGLERLEMRLSPQRPGREMLLDSLSHLLSVVQALVPVTGQTRIAALRFTGSAGATAEDGLELQLEFESPFPRAVVCFELRQVQAQPRPAWLAVNGYRMDRRITMPASAYQLAFVAGDRIVQADDPTAALVYRFLDTVREAASKRERIRDESTAIAERVRLYQQIVQSYDRYVGYVGSGGSGGSGGGG